MGVVKRDYGRRGRLDGDKSEYRYHILKQYTTGYEDLEADMIMNLHVDYYIEYEWMQYMDSFDLDINRELVRQEYEDYAARTL
jgi:hypothetical protein